MVQALRAGLPALQQGIGHTLFQEEVLTFIVAQTCLSHSPLGRASCNTGIVSFFALVPPNNPHPPTHKVHDKNNKQV